MSGALTSRPARAFVLALSCACCSLFSCKQDIGVVGERLEPAAGGAGAAGSAGGNAGGGAGSAASAGAAGEVAPIDAGEPDEEPSAGDECVLDEEPCQACTEAAPCAGELSCLEGLCRECLEDVDCGADGQCERGRCESEEESEEEEEP